MLFADRDDDKQIITSGPAAMFRRHPEWARKTAAGAIVGGALLFVVASVVLPAGADPGHKKTAAHVAAVQPDLGLLLPAVENVLDSKPRHVANQAPATKAVISGLAANGIPNVALNAYRVAAARLANAAPGCGIDWPLLAGIGREESDHGRFAGATLNADGTSTPHIIGIPLNGNGTERIGDTDHGLVDGDPVYDRAVGPMQFIPSTWAAYGADANGDGRADIFNINDAALTAGRYLCAAGGNLRTHTGQVAAVLAYNHSDQYLAQVLALANAYRSGVAVHGSPFGNTSGGLPPVSNSGYFPPANPGPPTAVDRTTATKAPAKKSATTANDPSAAPAQAPRATRGNVPTTAAASTTRTPGVGATSTAPPVPPAPIPTPKTTLKPLPTPTKTCLLWDIRDPHKCDLYS